MLWPVKNELAKLDSSEAGRKWRRGVVDVERMRSDTGLDAAINDCALIAMALWEVKEMFSFWSLEGRLSCSRRSWMWMQSGIWDPGGRSPSRAGRGMNGS